MPDRIDIPASFLKRLAEAAAAETLPRFRDGGEVTNKLEGGYDPVTEADRAAEKAIRALIAEHYPDHGVIGEEFGAERADSRHVWIIDPIDGTRAFVAGLPLWGTVIGLTEDGRAITGLMSQPFIGEFFHAGPSGAFREGPGGTRPLATRKTTSLTEAILCTTTPAMFAGVRREAYDRVEGAARMTRYGTDCYGYAMLAAGQIDLVVEAGLQAYDIVGLVPLIEGAGGVVTTWRGDRPEKGGDIVAAATPELHAATLRLLASGEG